MYSIRAYKRMDKSAVMIKMIKGRAAGNKILRPFC